MHLNLRENIMSLKTFFFFFIFKCDKTLEGMTHLSTVMGEQRTSFSLVSSKSAVQIVNG